MNEVQKYQQEVIKKLHFFDSHLQNTQLYQKNLNKWNINSRKHIKELKMSMLKFDEQIKQIPNLCTTNYNNKYEELQVKFQKLSQQSKIMSRGSQKISDKSQGISQLESMENNAVTNIIAKGDRAQDHTLSALMHMQQIAAQGTQMAADINVELARQIEQLDRINDDLKDTSSALQRAKKTIIYFVKQLQCDKFLLALILLDLLALTALIALLVKKG